LRDPKDKALNEAVEEDVNPAAPPAAVEEATEEVVETEPEATAEGAEETTETGGEPKKGYSQRVQELANEKNVLKEQVKSLQDKIAELTSPVGLPVNPAYEPQVKPGSEVTPDQYRDDVLKAADAIVTLRVKQSEAANRINNEAADVMRTYPELDPESDSFDEALSDGVTEATEAYVKANPYTASVKGFVAKLMKPYKGAVTKEVGKATEQIAKQVSEAALKPTSIRKGEKTAEEMTPEELEQKLGIVQN
jgi:hypothetical protein